MLDREQNRVIQPKTIPELVALLTTYGIPVERFGIGPRMPLQALLEQVRDGTVELEDRSGKLLRTIWLLSLDVFYEHEGKLLRLCEDSQMPLDRDSGNEVKHKKSRRRMDWSIAKKVPKVKWTIGEAARMVKLELGFDVTPERLSETQSNVYYRQSSKFPGFRNHIRMRKWTLVLRQGEYEPEGYVFDDKYQRSYFRWKT